MRTASLYCTQHKRGGRMTTLVRTCGAGLFPLACGLVLSACDRQPPHTSQMMPTVSTITVTEKPLLLNTELPGRTAPYLIAEIRPQVSGLVLKRCFTEGSDVKTGQVLYEIDPAPFKAAMDSAEANLVAARKATDRARAALSVSLAGVDKQRATTVFARANRKRFEELLKEKAVSTSDCEQAVTEADGAEAGLKAAEAQVQSDRGAVAVAEAAIQQAVAALETTRINLGYTKITAPISGRIGTSTVTDGAIVTAYQAVPLATIQQLDPIYVNVPQSTVDQLRLRKRLADGRLNRDKTNASKVQLFLEDGSKYEQEGSLQFSDISVDTTTGSVILRMVFPNPTGELLPGMFVRAIVQEGVNNKAILVPQQTVSRDTKGNPVTLLVDNDGKVALRSITLDRAIDDQWLVTSGLHPGERIIAEGSLRVRPGMEVKAVPFETGDTPAAPAGSQPPHANK